MGNWPVRLVPHPLPTDVFRPHPSDLARSVLGIDPDATVIAFGAADPASNTSKGWDLFMAAIHRLDGRVPSGRVLLFGPAPVTSSHIGGMPVQSLGRVSDDRALALVYSAADVLVVASRQEAFGQVASEAQACGTAVVAFGVGGLLDIIDDGVTGVLVEPTDTQALAEGIAWAVSDRARLAAFGERATRRARQLWAPEIVARRYLEIYCEVAEGSSSGGGDRDEESTPRA